MRSLKCRNGPKLILVPNNPSFFIPAEREMFIDPGIVLPFEFGKGPVVLPGLNLIKPAFVPVVDIHEEDIVRPDEGEPWYELGRQCLTNWCFGRHFCPVHIDHLLPFPVFRYEIYQGSIPDKKNYSEMS